MYKGLLTHSLLCSKFVELTLCYIKQGHKLQGLLPAICCSAAVNSACGGRRTTCMTAVSNAADGRRTMTFTT